MPKTIETKALRSNQWAMISTAMLRKSIEWSSVTVPSNAHCRCRICEQMEKPLDDLAELVKEVTDGR